jgi:hypothetical protein
MFLARAIAASRRRGTNLNIGLAHWWDLAASASSETDLVGSANVPRFGTVTTDASGAPDGGSCVDLGAAAGYYRISSADDLLNYSEDYSTNIWSNSSAYSSFGNWLINQRNDTSQRKFQIRISSINSSVAMFPNGNLTAALASTPATGAWIMSTLVVRGGSLEHWQNGALVDTVALSGAVETGNAPFAIGAGSWSPGLLDIRHRGRLFGAGMWSRALSAGEINELHNGGSGRRYASL